MNRASVRGIVVIILAVGRGSAALAAYRLSDQVASRLPVRSQWVVLLVCCAVGAVLTMPLRRSQRHAAVLNAYGVGSVGGHATVR